MTVEERLEQARLALHNAAMLYAVTYEHLHDTHWPLIKEQQKALEEAALAFSKSLEMAACA
jgi:hypothetical protein